MPAIVVEMLLKALAKFASQAVIEGAVILFLKELAKHTENSVDDELVQLVEGALKPSVKEVSIKEAFSEIQNLKE